MLKPGHHAHLHPQRMQPEDKGTLRDFAVPEQQARYWHSSPETVRSRTQWQHASRWTGRAPWWAWRKETRWGQKLWSAQRRVQHEPGASSPHSSFPVPFSPKGRRHLEQMDRCRRTGNAPVLWGLSGREMLKTEGNVQSTWGQLQGTLPALYGRTGASDSGLTDRDFRCPRPYSVSGREGRRVVPSWQQMPTHAGKGNDRNSCHVSPTAVMLGSGTSHQWVWKPPARDPGQQPPLTSPRFHCRSKITGWH